MSIRLNGSTSGYTEIDAPAVAGSNTLVLPTGNGSSGQFLQTNGSGTLSWAGGGKILQVVDYRTGAVATGTTIIPTDNTIPQNTEGDQYLSLTITPSSSSNKLVIMVNVHMSHSAAGNQMAALFQDSTANALATAWSYQQTGTGMTQISFDHYMTAGTTSSTTFKVRAGAQAAGTTTINGSSGVAFFNGTLYSSITIAEVAA
jgi:hypothetical protein